MANSMTPYDPQRQFAAIAKPFGLFVGLDDELFIPEKVAEYLYLAKPEIQEKSIAKIVRDENHLSILVKADVLINKTIRKILNLK